MKIRALMNNIASDEPDITEHEVEADENMSVQDLLDTLECSLADVSDYYTFSGIFAWNNHYCPYIISGDIILYDVPYAQANLLDFIRTHGIANHTIRITTGYPQAGGPGFLELLQIWHNTYSVLETIAVTCTITGIDLLVAAKWFCALFRKRKRKPQTCFDIVYSRTGWNHLELASYLDISGDEAKDLLRLLGYEYDKKQMQYLQGEHTDEIKKKLTEIEVRDL